MGLLLVAITGVSVPGIGAVSAATLPGAPTGVTAVAQVLAASVSWTAPSSSGGSAITSYTVTSNPDARTAVVAGSARSATVEGLRPSVPYTFTVQATNAAGAGAASTVSNAVTPTAPGSHYTSVTPARLLNGVSLAAAAATTVVVAGKGGVPTTGAAAAVLNVHVTRTGATGAVSVLPAGSTATMPSLSSALNTTISSMVVVPLGTGGAVAVRNSAGTAKVSVDVSGWVASAASASTAGLLTTVQSTRVLAAKSLAAGRSVVVAVAGKAAVPATGAAAVLVRVTTTAPTAAGSVIAFPAGAVTPTAATVSFAATTSGVSQALVKLAGGKLKLFNRTGTTKVSLDVLGWVSDSTAVAPSSYIRTVTPVRVLDTRTSAPALSATAPRTLTLAGAAGLPVATSSIPPVAAVVAVTAISPSVGSTLSVGGGVGLFLAAAKPATTIVVAPLDSAGTVVLSLSAGTTHVTVDVLGYYAGAVVVSVRDKILTAASEAAITAVAPDGTVTFAAGAPAQVASVATGDVLVAGVTTDTPNGLLRKVSGSKANPDGTRTVTTDEATLANAVISGTGSTTTAVPVAAPAAAAASGPPTVGPAVSAGISIDEYYPIDKTYGGSTAQLQITGGLNLHAGMDLDVSVHARLSNPVDAKLTVSASETFNVQADATAAVTYTDKRLLGQKYLAPQEFLIGPVPIVITPLVTANLDLDATAKGEAHAGINQSRGYTTTLKYEGGNTSTSVTPTGADPSIYGPTGAATAQVKVGVNFTYHYLVYGVAGPFVSGEPFMRTSTDGCGATLSYGLTFAGGIEAKVLGKNIRTQAEFEAIDKPLATTGYHCTWDGTVTSVRQGTDTSCNAASCSYNTHITWTPTLAESTPTGSTEAWTVYSGADWTYSVNETYSDTSPDCTQWTNIQGSGSGHQGPLNSSATATPAYLQWNGVLSNQYFFDGNTTDITVTRHFHSSGCGTPTQDTYTTDQWRTQIEVVIDGAEGASSLSGTYSDPQFYGSPGVPMVSTYSLNRHLPGT